MLLADARCVFMGFTLFISGFQVQAKSICALKGSSVDLLCTDQHGASWYTVHSGGHKNVLVEGHRVKYRMSGHGPTLTIKDLRASDENKYCCKEKLGSCSVNTIDLQVADLQVKVIPTTEGQTATLMCSTSCRLTEQPAAYIWYKNGEFLHEVWSPWYQEPVSSDKAVRYSCAIKGYEDLRAPEVSVDSVTPACFNVTYAGGDMCSYKQTSVEDPCTITYPREIHVKQTFQKGKCVKMTCQTSCHLMDSQTAYTWYIDGTRSYRKIQLTLYEPSYASAFSCAIKGFEELQAANICAMDHVCWILNYAKRRICAVEGSSVNISSEYFYPKQHPPRYTLWYKIHRNGTKEALMDAGWVEHHSNMKNRHILRFDNLMISDSAEYEFEVQNQDGRRKQSNTPGITLFVTGLNVAFAPSAVVTEGQRVTLTCSTSCPLTDNANYTWYLNGRPLAPTENQSKHLPLHPVSSQHAGNYSCAVKAITKNIISSAKTLTVQTVKGDHAKAAAAGGSAVLLVIVLFAVFMLWIGRKRTPAPLRSPESSNKMEELHPDPSAQAAEQEDVNYSTVHFSKTKTSPRCSPIQPHEPKEEEQAAYATVNFRSNMAPEVSAPNHDN